VLAQLESQDRTSARTMIDDLPLFAATARSPVPKSESDALTEALAALNPDEMSPRDALEALYRLKSKAAKQP